MSRVCVLFGLVLFSVAALPAVTITSLSFQVNGSSTPSGAVGGIVPGGPGEGDYLYGGTLNLYAGGGLGMPGAILTTGSVVPSLFSFRLTDGTVTCAGEVPSCPPTTLNFVAIINFSGPLTDQGGLFGVEGTGTVPPGFSASFGVGVEGNSTRQISNIPITSTILATQTFPAGLVASSGSTNLVLAMGLIFPRTPVGTSIDLPNSLFEQIGVQSPNSNTVPEPSTVALVGLGVAGAFWFRRRMN